MITVTKRKHAQGWEVLANREPTGLIITKGDPPRYRERQEWLLVTLVGGSSDWSAVLFRTYGMQDAMDAVETIVRRCAT